MIFVPFSPFCSHVTSINHHVIWLHNDNKKMKKERKKINKKKKEKKKKEKYFLYPFFNFAIIILMPWKSAYILNYKTF